MTDAPKVREALPENRRAITIAVLASVALTTAAVPIAWQIEGDHWLVELVRPLTGKEAPADPEDIAQRLRDRLAAGASDVTALAREAVAGARIETIQAVATHLMRQDDPEAARLGVLVIEEGALERQDAALLTRAGTEYWLGRHVERDFDKAMRYLTDPVVNILPSAHYFLGQVYLDGRNPRCDIVRGIAELRQAESMGLEAAKKMLNETLAGPASCRVKPG